MHQRLLLRRRSVRFRVLSAIEEGRLNSTGILTSTALFAGALPSLLARTFDVSKPWAANIELIVVAIMPGIGHTPQWEFRPAVSSGQRGPDRNDYMDR